MGSRDNWIIPFTGQEEGLNYVQLADGIRVYDVRHIIEQTYVESQTDKTDYAVHHATGLYTGTTIQADLAYIRGIDAFHKAPPPQGRGWPGFGYHRMINPHTGRTYLVASSATVRAHVANMNHLLIGYCFMSGWDTQRPPEIGMKALINATQWETDMRGGPMGIHPHKFYQNDNVCPGGWAQINSWNGTLIQPKPVAPPPPPPDNKAEIRTRLQQIRNLTNEVDQLL